MEKVAQAIYKLETGLVNDCYEGQKGDRKGPYPSPHPSPLP
jgi:hypothetical protein